MSSNVVPFNPRAATTKPADTATGLVPGALLRMTDRAVYNVREVSQMLSISLGGTYQRCRDGQIPALKLGGRWVIPKARFHAWLDNLPIVDPAND